MRLFLYSWHYPGRQNKREGVGGKKSKEVTGS